MSSTLPAGTQHRRPWSSTSRALRVPLWYEEAEGEWIEGKIEVPARLAHAQPDTNAKLEFNKLVTAAIDRWTLWRAGQGWYIASKPQVRGPYDPPTATVNDDPLRPDMFWYFVKARFKREAPVYAKFEDVLAIREQVARQALAPVVGDSGWVNPLEFAEKRRQAMGIKRKEYLTGPLQDMQEPPPAPPSGVRQLAV